MAGSRRAFIDQQNIVRPHNRFCLAGDRPLFWRCSQPARNLRHVVIGMPIIGRCALPVSRLLIAGARRHTSRHHEYDEWPAVVAQMGRPAHRRRPPTSSGTRPRLVAKRFDQCDAGSTVASARRSCARKPALARDARGRDIRRHLSRPSRSLRRLSPPGRCAAPWRCLGGPKSSRLRNSPAWLIASSGRLRSGGGPSKTSSIIPRRAGHVFSGMARDAAKCRKSSVMASPIPALEAVTTGAS